MMIPIIFQYFDTKKKYLNSETTPLKFFSKLLYIHWSIKNIMYYFLSSCSILENR
jgi:hypothetical protein